jgi:hypothetical protein
MQTLMQTPVRVLLLIFVALALLLGIGFYLQLPWAIGLWPWPDSFLSYIFLSSYAVAIGGGILWVALSGSLGAAKGGLLNLGVACAGMAAFAFRDAQANRAVLPLAIFCLVGLLSCAAGFWLVRHEPVVDHRATPPIVRISFLVFTAALLATAVALIAHAPTIFPWPLRAESSVIFGWAFLGAACYFLFGVLIPRWDNAGGQLLGFLGYDLVLIVPFLRHFATVQSSHMLSLVTYIIVLLYSGTLAVYFLFIARTTRRWSVAREPMAAVENRAR